MNHCDVIDLLLDLPEDEPVFLLNASDPKAWEAVQYYSQLIYDDKRRTPEMLRRADFAGSHYKVMRRYLNGL